MARKELVDTDKMIAWMIRQGRRSDEIAAEVGVKEHFILAEMKAQAEA